jgi:hypothetical protein
MVTTGRSIFRRTYLKNTGCDLKHSFIKQDVDDGFEIRRRTYSVLRLIVK